MQLRACTPTLPYDTRDCTVGIATCKEQVIVDLLNLSAIRETLPCLLPSSPAHTLFIKALAGLISGSPIGFRRLQYLDSKSTGRSPCEFNSRLYISTDNFAGKRKKAPIIPEEAGHRTLQRACERFYRVCSSACLIEAGISVDLRV